MPNEMTITQKDNYLHVIAKGRASLENATELWRSIAEACKAHNCFNVLGEQYLENPTSTMDAWNHQSIFVNAGITSKYLIAWVDHNPKTFKQTEFVRTVLANRDIGYGKLFSNAEEAETWLLKKIDARAKRKSSPT